MTKCFCEKVGCPMFEYYSKCRSPYHCKEAKTNHFTFNKPEYCKGPYQKAPVVSDGIHYAVHNIYMEIVRTNDNRAIESFERISDAIDCLSELQIKEHKAGRLK